MIKCTAIFCLIVLSGLFVACDDRIDEKTPPGFVLIKGGRFLNQQSNLYALDAQVSDFYIGEREVTQKEWQEIMGNNPSFFKGENLPVESVSWYDCILYCNKRSILEGLKPYYQVDSILQDPLNQSIYDSLKLLVVINETSNGYRLPTEAEWEYAASGGSQTQHFLFSGGDLIEEVAWYWRNCGDELLEGNWNWPLLENNHCQTHPVGQKRPNELGLYDMTGNVREWCEDWYQDHDTPAGLYRSQRGGGWIGLEKFNVFYERGSFEPNGVGPDQGFRLCRNKQ
ncbi:MAG: formylglycine-generating enzyme family protein [Bacteroidota bacterium]